MSGNKVSTIITYDTTTGQQLVLKKKLYFPMLRTIPNNTHATLSWSGTDPTTPLTINSQPVKETALTLTINGILNTRSYLAKNSTLTRHISPSTSKAAIIEQCIVTNSSSTTIALNIPNQQTTDTTDPQKGVYGSYILQTTTYGSGSFELKPGESTNYAIVWSAHRSGEQAYDYSAGYEYNKRLQFVQSVEDNLILQTPDNVINKAFAFAKIRVTESIYDTKGGLMHVPGGGSYYAAIWANDQAEYVDPFFPFLGNPEANESAINSFRWFASYMNKDYKPIPSSIIAEGVDIWNGAGDRRDQAMIAYGAARFALAYGDRNEAKKLWPLIEWCLEYLRRKKTSDGVIASDADELERRFPAGKINLSTNTLAYGAWLNAADLAETLKNPIQAQQLRNEAAELRKHLEKYFGATIQG